jgi:hypothetical protein
MKGTPIPPAVILRRVVRHNPKKVDAGGWNYIENFYPPPGGTITIAELFEKGRAAGLTDREQRWHVWWDQTHAYVEITLDGKVWPAGPEQA